MVYFKQTNNNSKPGPLPFREIAGASRWPRQSNFVYDWINLCCIFSDRKLIRRRTSSRNFSGKRKIVKNDRFRELFENFGRKFRVSKTENFCGTTSLQAHCWEQKHWETLNDNLSLFASHLFCGGRLEVVPLSPFWSYSSLFSSQNFYWISRTYK